MDEDQILQSIIADPQLTDPSIDVSNLRTTTPTRSELLAAVPEFSGLKFDPTQTSYIEDLYSVYSGGLPTLATDTAQIPESVDTSVDVGGGGGMDQVTGDSVAGFDPGVTPGPSGFIGLDPDMDIDPQDFAQEDYGIYDPTAATGQIGDGSIAVENIAQNQTPYDVPMDIDDPGASIENIIAQQNQTIPEAPPISPVTTSIDAQGNIFDAQTEEYLGNKFDEVALTGASPEQQNLISQAFSKVGSTANDIMRDLSEIPGAVANFVDKTVDIAGQKINVGGTLLRAGINKIVGGPISLVFDGIGALASNLPPGISETTNKAREVGLLQGDGTVTQDKYGINTQSMFGDYNQYNIDRVDQLEDKVNKTPRDIQELKERKDYIDSTGATGDITPDATPTDIATGNVTGDGSVAEQVAQKEKQEAFADIQNQIGRTRDQDPAPAPATPTNVGNPFGYGGGGNGGNGGGQNTGGARGGGTSATSSGLGGLGFSDIRLKDNVELIGKSPSNINIYKFNYKGDSTVYEGVIANEVPWASVEASNGYLMVDYNKIDVELKKHAKR